MLGVRLPDAADRHVLAGSHAGDASHHGDDLPFQRQKAQHRIAVFGVLKDQAMYGTVYRGQFFHKGSSFVKQWAHIVRPYCSCMMSALSSRCTRYSARARA